MANVPADLKYTKTHEWLRIDGDMATIGITDYAQSELGDIVYVDLPNVGRVLNSGDSFGSVESVKTVSDVYTPVSGEVVDVNSAIGAQSELLNSDPYGKGWMIKLRLTDPSQTKTLLDPQAYEGNLH
jgi:glycine cleavage system H protein